MNVEMSLQNRVTPFGEIIATEARGTMMGNRGGRIHRDDKTLGRRRWASIIGSAASFTTGTFAMSRWETATRRCSFLMR